MSLVDDYYHKCATCTNYGLGSSANMKSGVGFKCFEKGNFYSMEDGCGSHLFGGYAKNNCVTDKNISDAKKMLDTKSNCYITTIICNILGKKDDCEELQTLRKVREYIKQNKNLLWILVSYDEIGPTIANYLATDQNKENLARVIYWKFIKPSCDFVNKNDMKSAIEYYKLMTTYLIHHYNIPYNYNYNPDIKDLNMEDLGHARKLKKA